MSLSKACFPFLPWTGFRVRICLPVFVCLHVCVCVSVCLCVSVYLFCVCLCLYVCVTVNVGICLWIYVCVSVHAYWCLCARVYMCVCESMSGCVCVCDSHTSSAGQFMSGLLDHSYSVPLRLQTLLWQRFETALPNWNRFTLTQRDGNPSCWQASYRGWDLKWNKDCYTEGIPQPWTFYLPSVSALLGRSSWWSILWDLQTTTIPWANSSNCKGLCR